jgi:hypothetical protein
MQKNMPMPMEMAVSNKVKGGASMWNFKKCPRCRGDIFIDEDSERCYEKCLQCGYERELEKVSVLRKSPEAGSEKAKSF